MDEAGADDALARLERSLQSVQRECRMAVSLSRPHHQLSRGLPRAAQLGLVAGIPPVDPVAESDCNSGQTSAAAVPLAATSLPFHLAPPIAADRLQPLRPPRPRNYRVRGALYILIATLIAGSIAYQIFGGAFTATEAAQAALSAVVR